MGDGRPNFRFLSETRRWAEFEFTPKIAKIDFFGIPFTRIRSFFADSSWVGIQFFFPDVILSAF